MLPQILNAGISTQSNSGSFPVKPLNDWINPLPTRNTGASRNKWNSTELKLNKNYGNWLYVGKLFCKRLPFSLIYKSKSITKMPRPISHLECSQPPSNTNWRPAQAWKGTSGMVFRTLLLPNEPSWFLFFLLPSLLTFCFLVPSTFLLPFTLLFSPILFVSLALVSGVLYFVVSFFSLFVHAFLLVNIAYLIICLCIYTKNKTTQIQLVHILIQDRDAIAHFCCGIVVFVKKLLVKLL